MIVLISVKIVLYIIMNIIGNAMKSRMATIMGDEIELQRYKKRWQFLFNLKSVFLQLK